MRAAVVIGLATLALQACTPRSRCERDRIVLRVTDPDGATPAAYQVTFSWDAAPPVTVRCPGGIDGPAACSAAGATLAKAPASLFTVVKARGYRTALLQGHPACDSAEPDLAVALDPLPEVISNDDYATGFTLDGGTAAFARLAVRTPGEAGETLVVKFFVTGLPDAASVYFMNTGKQPLHYAFAREVLGMAVSQEEFVAETYTGEHRPNLAGSIVLHPDRKLESAAAGAAVAAPHTVEFFPSDNLSPRLALLAHRLLEERLGHLPLGGTARRLFYVPPTTTHEEALREAERDFARQDALWLTRAEIYGNVTVQYLNPGKGCGRVHRLSPEELLTTPLSYKDLVVLSRLPNEVPLLGGTITEELQTPLAHVNVAARTRGTPNMALLGAGADTRIAPLLGELACLEVEAGAFSLRAVSLAEAQAFWDTLVPPDPIVPTADLSATTLLPFAKIGFGDAARVGVKAANVAELSHLIPDHAPDGFAVPFAWYHDHLTSGKVAEAACGEAEAACTAEKRSPAVCTQAASLCAEGATRGLSLRGYVDLLLDAPAFQASTAVAEAALAGLRYLIEGAPVDPARAVMLDNAVRARWGDARKVRLRSSTNCEDLPNFSGAGLYRSISVRADSKEPPSARIRRVWASVWNFAAHVERTFWNIDHRAVEMGLAVHPSYPDEACNGVVITQSIANRGVAGHYVNVQLGEASVTNPENGILPEIFTVVPATGGDVLVLRDRYSSLSPGQPIMTEPEIAELYAEAKIVQRHFAALYGKDAATLALDLEFKRVPPSRHLVIKQVRPYTAGAR